MHRRELVIGLAAGITGAAVAVAGPAVGHGQGQAAGRADSGHTVRVLSVPVEESFIDTGDSGPSLGDMYVFNTTLKHEGDEVGRADIVCTGTSTKTGDAQCVATAWFDDKGQITVQGIVPGDEPEEFWLAITGGTGAYAGADGQLLVRELGGGRERLIFHLED